MFSFKDIKTCRPNINLRGFMKSWFFSFYNAQMKIDVIWQLRTLENLIISFQHNLYYYTTMNCFHLPWLTIDFSLIPWTGQFVAEACTSFLLFSFSVSQCHAKLLRVNLSLKGWKSFWRVCFINKINLILRFRVLLPIEILLVVNIIDYSGTQDNRRAQR